MEKIELLKKIKTLSEQGIDGEKSNATELYNKLLKQYNILEADLNEDTEREYKYKFEHENELYIYLNICEYVKGVRDDKMTVTEKKAMKYSTKVVKNIITEVNIYLTDSQKILFDIVLNFYKPYFDKKIAELRIKQDNYLTKIINNQKEEEIALIHAIIIKNKLHRKMEPKNENEKPKSSTNILNKISESMFDVDDLGFNNAIDYNNLLEN